MKGIVHTVLLLTILPTFAMADPDWCSGITDEFRCMDTPGCEYLDNMLAIQGCLLCEKGKYNDGSFAVCQDCLNGPSDTSYTESGNTSSDCPWEWSCSNNQYYDSDTKQCENCPTDATSDKFIVTNKTVQEYSISHCQCRTGYELSDNNCTPKTYQCPAGQYLPQSTPNCKHCTQGYYCSGGSYTYSESQDQGMTKCPAGSTSAQGSDAKTDCYMNSDTKFCDASGANCVSFGAIFGTTQINYNLD